MVIRIQLYRMAFSDIFNDVIYVFGDTFNDVLYAFGDIFNDVVYYMHFAF